MGACTVALRPLHDLIADHVLAAGRLHGDDTPVPVLATPGLSNLGTAALRPGGFRGPGQAVDRVSDEQRAEHAAGGGVRRAGRDNAPEPDRQRPRPRGRLEDGVFEPPRGLDTLAPGQNPGSASFRPLADTGADLALGAGETGTLGARGTGGGPCPAPRHLAMPGRGGEPERSISPSSGASWLSPSGKRSFRHRCGRACPSPWSKGRAPRLPVPSSAEAPPGSVC